MARFSQKNGKNLDQGMQQTVASPPGAAVPESVGVEAGQVPVGCGVYWPHWEASMSLFGTPQPDTVEYQICIPEQPDLNVTSPPHVDVAEPQVQVEHARVSLKLS
ncbi:MAG: hypothetical protein R3B13_12445 [Polyangiaceae bacterium]